MTKIFCDLDGVLVDFERGFEINNGMHPRSISEPEMWKRINSRERHWHDLPALPGALQLWARISNYSPTILTGCPRGGFKIAEEGKREWCSRELGLHVPVITCFSKDKQLHMNEPGDILIDDMLKNCTRWEEAGGRAIHYTSVDAALAQLTEWGF